MRGDIGDEAARADDGEAGNEPAPLGPSWPCLCPAVAVAVTWERANGDGVCCRAWCMRDACAAARAAIEPERGLGSGGFALELGGGAAASSRLFSFCCAAGTVGESKPENERERGRTVAACGRKLVRGMTFTFWFTF